MRGNNLKEESIWIRMQLLLLLANVAEWTSSKKVLASFCVEMLFKEALHLAQRIGVEFHLLYTVLCSPNPKK